VPDHGHIVQKTTCLSLPDSLGNKLRHQPEYLCPGFCQSRIAWFKRPKFVNFLQAFPLTASGKVMKIKLREQSAALWPDV